MNFFFFLNISFWVMAHIAINVVIAPTHNVTDGVYL